METINTPKKIAMALAARCWFGLRLPQFGFGLVIILLLVWGLMLYLPQRTLSDLASTLSAEADWIQSLPLGLQGLGPWLFFLGFSRLLQSAWFWLPVALLFLHCLIFIGEIAIPLRHRWQAPIASLKWQHPLARRFEDSVRLSDDPDEFLAVRKQRLQAAGFIVTEAAEGEQRMLGAKLRRESWGGLVVLYGGVLLLIVALLMSAVWLRQERRILSTQGIVRSNLLGATLALTEIEGQRGQIVIQDLFADSPSETIDWRQFWPTFFGKYLIFPLAINPLLTIEMRDASGIPMPLVPLQETLTTTTQIVVPLAERDTPILFSTQSSPLVFQVVSEGESGYNVQVQHAEEAELIRNLHVELGETVDIASLSGSIFLNHELEVIIRQDLGLWLYPVALILLIIGLVGFIRRPIQLWLIPDIKGRGGQLYGVVETFGSEREMRNFLAQILAEDDAPTPQS